MHIPDKHALMAEVYRVLRPGGCFIASDWLIGHDGPPSPEMAAYIAAEGLDFGMASPSRYASALREAGFDKVSTTSRNALECRSGPSRASEVARAAGRSDGRRTRGRDFVDHNIEIWERRLPVLRSANFAPTHLHGRKPVAN